MCFPLQYLCMCSCACMRSCVRADCDRASAGGQSRSLYHGNSGISYPYSFSFACQGSKVVRSRSSTIRISSSQVCDNELTVRVSVLVYACVHSFISTSFSCLCVLTDSDGVIRRSVQAIWRIFIQETSRQQRGIWRGQHQDRSRKFGDRRKRSGIGDGRRDCGRQRDCHVWGRN